MSKFAIALILSMLALQATAEEHRLRLVEPKGSPLKVAKLERANFLAEFAGRTWVTGTLIVERHDGTNGEPDYLLIPDAGSRKLLPHFASYVVDSIALSNGPEAVRMAGGAALAERVAQRQARKFKLTGAFEIEQFAVGVECDSPWARAIVTRVDIPDQRTVAALKRPETC